MKTIAQGAEAVIKLAEDGQFAIKERISKGYRILALDETIIKRRTKAEAKLMRDARSNGIDAPQIYETKESAIKMQFIKGEKVKDILSNASTETRDFICRKIGEYAARLHSRDMIHGDLTTSNFILSGDEVYIIDFGLGFYSKRPEDKAVDMHLLHQALKSTHFNILKDAWEIILNAYKSNYEDANIIVKKLEEIERRGRYK